MISNVLEAAYCNGTHHKLAFHSLNHLQAPDSKNWRKLFLSQHELFLEGSKAPDKKFKDFKNHVLHVGHGLWGGAPLETRRWYLQTVEYLREENWSMAAYAAGVLSHYVTDPVMPFHTAQSEAESNIHRAVEWSVNKSYNSLRKKIDAAAAATTLSEDSSEKWLENLIIAAAQYSNQSYQDLIDHYDFKKGSKNPPQGFDQLSRDRFAELLGYAQVLLAFILDRAIREANVAPPPINLTLESVVASLTIPVAWVTRKMSDAAEIKTVQAMYKEFSKTGKVDKKLTDDVRVIRDEVQSRKKKETGQPVRQQQPSSQDTKPTSATKKTDPEETIEAPESESQKSTSEKKTEVPEAAEPASQKQVEKAVSESPAPSRTPAEGLALDSDLEAAPSIGPKTATRLSKAGLHTVQDLLDCDPDAVSKAVATRYITPQVIRDWQDQALLVHQLPQLRGHDAQILVGSGIRTLTDLAYSQPEELFANVIPFVESSAGKRVIRSGSEPDLTEVTRWVEWAESAA